MNKIEPYSLYQTLTCKPHPKIPLKKNQKTKIIDTIPALKSNETTALVRLIIEHYRCTTLRDASENDKVINEISYDSIYESKIIDGKRIFNVDKLPKDLQWIILKFIEVCEGQQA